jgi:fumarylacetoacetate (FAA) hydrolase family protein
MDLEIDEELLGAFERQLDPRHPEAGEIPARVLGYGEISTVFEIGVGSQADIAYKRMPIFETDTEL